MRTNSLIGKIKALHSLWQTPEIENAKAISFDVFDTLVQRPLESPKDVFYIVELLAPERGLRVPNFSLIRPEAEKEVRRGVAHGEVSLELIYHRIKDLYGLTETNLAKLHDLEIEVELKLCSAKPAGYELWSKAKSLGLPFILTSDMYLSSDTISKICTNAGYSGWQKIYVSSEYAVSKSQGGLFDVVLRDLGVRPSQLIHIGDNWKADIKRASERSIGTIWLPNPEKQFKKSKLKKNTGHRNIRVAPDLMRSFCVSLISQRTFSSRKPKLSTRDIGYMALGPCVYAFTTWLAHEAKQRGVSKLFFLSRDTSLFLKAYKMLGESNSNLLPAQYMFSSRRAACLPSIASDEDIIDIACSFFDESTTPAELVKARFGLKESYLTHSRLSASGFASAHEAIGKTQFSRISKLCLLLRDDILRSAREERSAALTYLAKLGFDKEKKPAFVDIGWSGTIQKSMTRLVNRPTTGLYYATFERAAELIADGNEVYSFAEHLRRAPRKNKLASNRLLTEFVFCGSEKSLVRFDSNGDPVFRENDLSPYILRELDQLHEGAIDFVRDLLTRVGPYLSFTHADPAAGEYFYEELLKLDFVRDKRLGALVENSFGGDAKMSFHELSPRLWKGIRK